ncbi:hypothetical protein B0H12DRAFT_1007451, partial [Mycena haematopus]
EARCLKHFDDALDAVTIAACSCCRAEAFNVKLKASGECGRCHADSRDIKLWSDENRVNPKSLRPACLKNLTDMEEMLIARVKPVMPSSVDPRPPIELQGLCHQFQAGHFAGCREIASLT